jgi:hypothetical protein
LRDDNVDRSTLCSLRNFGAPIHQWVLRVLERKNSRPGQPVNSIDNPLQDHKDCSGFLGNPVLALIVERTVKAIQIQV